MATVRKIVPAESAERQARIELADAFDSFYFVERWAMLTLLSRSMGQPTHRMPDEILWEKPDRDQGLTPRVLDREEPDYKS